MRRFAVLRRWKDYVPKILAVLQEKGLEGYVAGSVARGNYDCSSDFDLVVVTKDELSREERLKLKGELLEEFEREGVPPWFPLELHLVTEDELRKYPERVPLTLVLPLKGSRDTKCSSSTRGSSWSAGSSSR